MRRPIDQTLDILNFFAQEQLTPITPLESAVEMFTRGRPSSIVPTDAALARRLSIVPEIASPSSTSSLLDLPRSTLIKRRPLSEVTEIHSDQDDESEIDEECFQQDDYDNEHHEDDVTFNGNCNEDSYSEGSDIEEENGEEMTYHVRVNVSVIQWARLN